MIQQDSCCRVLWRCGVCGTVLRFHPHDEEHIDFFAVYHLQRKHGMSRSDVIGYDPLLESVLKEFDINIEEEDCIH